jgi:hypothetical protein
MSRRFRLILAAAVATVALLAPATANARTFCGTVGPNATITLKTKCVGGVRVRTVRAGLHTFVIRDRSSAHNFRLLVRGRVLRATTVPFIGRRVWRNVRIRAARTYVYDCRPHLSFMRGTFRGVRAA